MGGTYTPKADVKRMRHKHPRPSPTHGDETCSAGWRLVGSWGFANILNQPSTTCVVLVTSNLSEAWQLKPPLVGDQGELCLLTDIIFPTHCFGSDDEKMTSES